MTKLAKLVYRNSELRKGSAVQVQLAEFFIEALNNPFIKDAARSNLTTLSEDLSPARENERLYERLHGCQTKESTTISCTAKSVSTKQQNGTLYQVIPTEEAFPKN